MINSMNFKQASTSKSFSRFLVCLVKNKKKAFATMQISKHFG